MSSSRKLWRSCPLCTHGQLCLFAIWEYSPKKRFSLWGLLWPEQYIRTEQLRVFASFQLASPGQSRVMSCIPATGGSGHMLREPDLLPYSAHPFHIQRELCKGCATEVWFGSCVIAHDQTGAHLGPGCRACHLAELWGRFSSG